MSADIQPPSSSLAEMFTHLLHNTSHELRTPLQLILSYAEMLQSHDLGTLNPEQRAAVLQIIKGSHMLKAIFEQIEIMVAAEAQQGTAQPFDIENLLRRIILEQHDRITHADLTCEFTGLKQSMTLIGDDTHIGQAFRCLLDNAIKFTPSGGRIQIGLFSHAKYLHLMVSDTGIGIEEEKLSLIFERFVQADASYTRHYGGLGLGLSVVKAVVHEHRGQINLASQLRRGTSVTIKLPLA